MTHIVPVYRILIGRSHGTTFHVANHILTACLEDRVFHCRLVRYVEDELNSL
jgi:hypothetical protein